MVSLRRKAVGPRRAPAKVSSFRKQRSLSRATVLSQDAVIGPLPEFCLRPRMLGFLDLIPGFCVWMPVAVRAPGNPQIIDPPRSKASLPATIPGEFRNLPALGVIWSRHRRVVAARRCFPTARKLGHHVNPPTMGSSGAMTD